MARSDRVRTERETNEHKPLVCETMYCDHCDHCDHACQTPRVEKSRLESDSVTNKYSRESRLEAIHGTLHLSIAGGGGGLVVGTRVRHSA